MQNSSEYPDHLSVLSRTLLMFFFSDNLSRNSRILHSSFGGISEFIFRVQLGSLMDNQNTVSTFYLFLLFTVVW